MHPRADVEAVIAGGTVHIISPVAEALPHRRPGVEALAAGTDPAVVVEMQPYGGYEWFGPMELCYYGIQLVHMLVLVAYVVLLIVLESPESVVSRSPEWTWALGCSVVVMAVSSSVVRAVYCHFSLAAALCNMRFLSRVGRAANMSFGLVGQADPGIDLSIVAQYFAYTCVIVACGETLGSLVAVVGLLVCLGDYVCVRLRFVQGRSDLKEKWKRCPLIDSSTIEVCEFGDKPDGVFALSYRWEDDNASGLSDDNTRAILELAAKRRAAAGFIDHLCKWKDGSMATLDVNKSVYTEAEHHLIFASKVVFDHFALRMRWKFFVLALVQIGWFVGTFVRFPATPVVIAAVAALLVLWVNHLRNYVTWGLQNSLPGLSRVWLRLEYECRRDSRHASMLASREAGAYQPVAFQSPWYAGLIALWWLLTMTGTPVCMLPDVQDMSGLASRDWSETISLIDEWTAHDSPFPTQRLLPSSQILLPETLGTNPGSPLVAHLIGGEVLYWMAGRLHKFDGFRGKISRQRHWFGWMAQPNSVVVH